MITPLVAGVSRPRVVAVIPARGGSKGVPGKNVARVGGVTLIARAIASALPTVDLVVVSTDDAVVARAAHEAGAVVVDRPANLAGDTTSSESVLLHALNSPLVGQTDVLVFIQATSPFIRSTDLAAAIDRVVSGACDVAFSAVSTYEFLWQRGPTGAVGVNHDHSYRLRRQDREPHYRETGAFYVMRAEGFREAGHRFFGRIEVAAVDERTSIEIDTHAELEAARALAPLLAEPSARLEVAALVMDFDGVHTDDLARVDEFGTEQVTVSRSDGMGIGMLRRAGMPMLILSTETNPVVSARAAKLGVEVLQGIDDKAAALTAWAFERDIRLSDIAYIGNDINDAECLALVGWPIVPADAHASVRSSARLVLTRPGGHGAVREVADLILMPAQPSTAISPRSTYSPTIKEESWPLSLAEHR